MTGVAWLQFQYADLMTIIKDENNGGVSSWRSIKIIME